MGVAIPLETIRRFSAIEDPEEFKAEVNRMLMNQRPRLMQNWILTAVYIGHERTRGGIIKPQSVVAEDIWQMPMGLVVDVGPACFKDTFEYSWYEEDEHPIKPGDWVTYTIGNSKQREINGVPCRIIQDKWIEAKWPDPRMITG